MRTVQPADGILQHQDSRVSLKNFFFCVCMCASSEDLLHNNLQKVSNIYRQHLITTLEFIIYLLPFHDRRKIIKSNLLDNNCGNSNGNVRT